MKIKNFKQEDSFVRSVFIHMLEAIDRFEAHDLPLELTFERVDGYVLHQDHTQRKVSIINGGQLEDLAEGRQIGLILRMVKGEEIHVVDLPRVLDSIYIGGMAAYLSLRFFYDGEAVSREDRETIRDLLELRFYHKVVTLANALPVTVYRHDLTRTA